MTEAHRRKVFRAAATYLAAAFVVLQVADLTFEPLGLSSGAYRILVLIAAAGFPVTLVLSWFIDLRLDPSTPAADGSAPTRYPRLPLVASALMLLVAAGAFAAFAAFRYRHAADSESATLAVLPFEVIGDPQLEYLGAGIVEMLSRNIDGAGNLHAVGSEISIQAAKKNKPADQIAKQLEARYIVTGNIARAGTQVRITATIQDFSRNGKQVTREATGTAEQLFEVVDRLSAQILASTRSGEDAHLSESAALTTKSLPALRAYLEGEEHYRKTQYDSAVSHFSNAISLDSTFALAYYRLAVVQVSRERAVPAREPLQRAIQFSDRLSERDQKMVHSFALAFDGKWRESEAELRALLERYPEDLEVMYTLGQLLTLANERHGRPYREAVDLLDKVLAADARFFCPI